jgi:heme oxygenase (biliverdin-producing, ferredoxin)
MVRIASARGTCPLLADGTEFSRRLKEGTRDLHARAEGTGFIGELLRRRGSRLGYALLLRNLAPVYQGMEAGLNHHAASPGVRAIVRRELYRSIALQSDLSELLSHGRGFALPLLHAGTRYVELISKAAQNEGAALIGHAYVRYLGDLSGGQVLRRLLNQSLGLEELSFFDFPMIENKHAFKEEYRRAFDGAGLELDHGGRVKVIEEAQKAFKANIDLSIEIEHYLVSHGLRRRTLRMTD